MLLLGSFIWNKEILDIYRNAMYHDPEEGNNLASKLKDDQIDQHNTIDTSLQLDTFGSSKQIVDAIPLDNEQEFTTSTLYNKTNKGKI